MGKEENMRLPSSLLIMLSVAAAFLPCRVNAQAFGNIVGSVSDPGGAVIPSATITAVESSTSFTRTTTTGTDGIYSLPRLPVGSYTVTASAPGFDEIAMYVRLGVDERGNRVVTVSLQGGRS